MDSLPDDSDIPFCHEVMLQEPLKLHGFSRDECLVTCHCSGVPYTFPRPYLAFIKLLLLVNNEITQTWKNEDKEDQVYWTSLRAYLNKLLQNTLTCFEKKKHPMALACWLHREFMLCCHDLNGRREYLGVMEKGGVAPYSVDTFELDWLTWWQTQFQHGYYMSDLYGGFEKLLREDHMIIKEASSRQLWHDMEDDGNSRHSRPSRLLAKDPTLPSIPAGAAVRIEPIIFVFKCLSHAPPDPPCDDNGDLDWDSILGCLSCLLDALNTSEGDVDVPRFLAKFDQVRWLDKGSLEGYQDSRGVKQTCSSRGRQVHGEKLLVPHPQIQYSVAEYYNFYY
ncbi:hypothetical protein V8E55_001302 [Tylopilus felleus]